MSRSDGPQGNRDELRAWLDGYGGFDAESFAQTVTAYPQTLDEVLERIERLVDDSPDRALALIMGAASLIGEVARHGGIPDRLEKWIERLRRSLGTLAARVEADAYWIEASGPPPSLSVGISFRRG